MIYETTRNNVPLKQVLIRKGEAIISNLPIPQIGSGELLVKVKNSCLSIGTESVGLKGSSVPIWKRALAQPQKVGKALKMAKDHGIRRVRSVILEAKNAEFTTGYSAAGIVVAVGNEITDIAVGDRVACAGSKYAYHAEFISVPRNLCVLIPEDVSFEEASTVTLGSIALQGLRRCQPTIGEIIVVIGLGVIGQLTAQLLRAQGCIVVGCEINQNRINTAMSLGMHYGLQPGMTTVDEVHRISNGFGADGVIITAASISDEIISSAFNMCRKKGRVILVGDVGLNLKRDDIFKKELDFLVSTSYGPGRYDFQYEENGVDYPIGYVRWTENRNMAEYLRQISSKNVVIKPLITARYPIDKANEAYQSIKSSNRPLLALLSFPEGNVEFTNQSEKYSQLKVSTIPNNKIQIAVIGAGSFAKLTHLPSIVKLEKYYDLRAVVNKTGPTAMAVGKQFNATYVTTDYQKVIKDEHVDAIIIATRHNLHGTLALEALKAGKHCFVEKPLVLSKDELDKIKFFYSNHLNSERKPILLTGYNRRFSPYFKRMQDLVEYGKLKFILNYKMNAGFIPLDHWVHGPEGGGRNLGEACHIYDLFVGLANSSVKSFSAHSLNSQNRGYRRNDNFIATFSFENGSIANLIYCANGHRKFSKESAELFVNGNVALLDDYKALKVYGKKQYSISGIKQDKGLSEEMKVFAQSILSGEFPIPLWQQFQSVEMAINVEDMLHDRC